MDSEFKPPAAKATASGELVASEELLSDAAIAPRPFRLKPWAVQAFHHKQPVVLCERFPAPLLTDANTVVMCLRKKKPVKLGRERLEKLERAMNDEKFGECQVKSVKELEELLQIWRVEAQTVAFSADGYYDAARVKGYTERLGRGSKRSAGLGTRDAEGDDSGEGEQQGSCGGKAQRLDSTHADRSASEGGSQAAIARICVALLRQQMQRQEQQGESAKAHIVADLGCGSGLSSEAFAEGAAAAAGTFCLGLDASRAMLEANASRRRAKSSEPQRPVVLHDLVYADISQPLPFRTGALDGAISVAAVHFACTAGADGRSGQSRSRTMMASVERAVRGSSGSAFAFNFFQHGGLSEGEIGQVLREAAGADKCSLLKDFPHHSRTTARSFMVGGSQRQQCLLFEDGYGSFLSSVAGVPSTSEVSQARTAWEKDHRDWLRKLLAKDLSHVLRKAMRRDDQASGGEKDGAVVLSEREEKVLKEVVGALPQVRGMSYQGLIEGGLLEELVRAYHAA